MLYSPLLLLFDLTSCVTPDIPELMQAVGAQAEPDVTFYEPISIGDEF